AEPCRRRRGTQTDTATGRFIIHLGVWPGMNLLTVIVNYRTADMVVDCLHSLADEVAAADAQVVVVDGDSGDGSVERIGQAIREHGYGQWCRLLPLDHNGGFAAGNNAGME